MSVLKIKDSNGVWIHIPTIKGEKGDSYILTAADKAEIAGMVETTVDDVQINGTSIVEDNIAKIPVAGEKLGAVKIGATQGWYGLRTNNGGNILVEKAASSTVKNGSESYQPIVPATQHEAAFYGLAKAAGHDEKSSTLPVGQYSDDAKAAIKTMLDVQDGVDGKDGVDGVSPTAKVEAVTGGAKITITDKDGTTTATVTNGKDGAAGQPGEKGDPGTPGAAGKDGADGYSPSAKVETVTGGAKITITDKNGTTTATVTNGKDGAAGSPGAAGKDGVDGVSPTAKVEAITGGAKITITDANGTTTANITNGAKGDPGDDYVLTAQDKTDIAEIVAENGIFYETHQMEQVARINNPELHWVNTSGKLSGISSKKYIFDADGVQDVVQLTRAQDANNKYYYGGTSETLGITLVYYYGDTKNSYIDFTNTVTTFKIFNYSTPVRAEIKSSYELGARLTQLIQYAIDNYYDNGDTQYYG